MMFRAEAVNQVARRRTQPDPPAIPKKARQRDRVGLHARPSAGIIKLNSLLVSECRA